MRKIILSYGAIAGLVVISTSIVSLEASQGHVWLGFLIMFIALSCIYVAIKQHRDQTLGGVITFSKAFMIGLGISAVAAAVYVMVWEIYLVLTNHAYIESYIDSILEAKKSAGVTEQEFATAMQETENLRQQYANPLMRIPMTFVEIFPVGFIVSLFSALVLRNQKK